MIPSTPVEAAVHPALRHEAVPEGRETDADRAEELRDALVKELRATGRITTDVVEAAFRAVPRHEFVPEGTPLEQVYAVDDSVATKRDEHGVVVSSISAAYIQARMIEQARLRPGANVLEVGSGGYNAALLAEVVGPDGRVASVDIDPEVVNRARALLGATGYQHRVTVTQADAEHGLPGTGLWDAIIVTVGAWDIPPAWREQLTADGNLVVPLRMNGVTRTIGFRREGDHLASTSAEVAGFVPMQGDGEHADQTVNLSDPQGHRLTLRFDSQPPDQSRLESVLAAGPVEVWSGVTIRNGVSFADLYLWFACFLPGFCRVAADPESELAKERKSWFPFGMLRDDGSFAYLSVHPALDGAGVEFGACGYGPNAEHAATAIVEQVQAWDARGRHGPGPQFAFWPPGSALSPLPVGTAVLEKAHGVVTIVWPATA